MPRSKSSIPITVCFSPDVAKAIRSFAKRKGASPQYFIRAVTMAMLRENGYQFNAENPTGKGERTDLRTIPYQEALRHAQELFLSQNPNK